MSFKRFIIGNSLYSIFNKCLITSVLIPYLRVSGLDPLQISTTQTIDSFFWFIFMYISGIIFDRFSAKINFLFGRIVECIAVFFLLNPTFFNIIISMALLGMSKGFIYGKYESYMYNYLTVAGKIHFYPRIASLYYFSWDIGVSGMAFTASILLKNYNYEVIIYISILLKILAILSIIFFVPNAKKSGLSQFKSTSIKEIFISVWRCMKNSKIFTYLVIFFGVLNFFTWPLCITIGDMILVDNGWSGEQIARYTSLITVAMAVGTILPIIFLKQGIKLKTCFYLSTVLMCLMLFVAIIYNVYLFIALSIIICSLFSIIEVSTERHFEKYSNQKIRGSVISFSISIGTLVRMLNIMLVGTIAKYHSYHLGLIVVVLPICLLLLFFCKDMKFD